MKLPFLKGFQKKETKQYFLALLLQDEKAGAVIFEEEAGVLQVVSQTETFFSTSVEDASFEELLDVCDKVISLAETKLPEEITTQKTVFGVKQDWIEDSHIKKEYLTKLKKVCDELSLAPIGFLVFTEAIIHLLQQEEGAPVSSILVEIGKKFLTISIIRANRIIEAHQAELTDSIPEAVDTALKGFKNIEILPARLILFNTEGSEKLSQQFISHTWSKSLPFLHVPQITILPPNFDTKAVLFGTASQMGFQVSHATLESLDKTTIPSLENSEQENSRTEEQKADAMEDLGFKTDEEVKPRPKDDQPLAEVAEPREDKDADFFGFVMEKDITKTPHTIAHQKMSKAVEKAPEEVIEEEIEEIPEIVKEQTTGFGKSREFSTESLAVVGGSVKGIVQFVKTIPFQQILTTIKMRLQHQTKRQAMATAATPSKEGSKKLLPILAIPGILVVLLLAILGYIFGLKATVTLHVSPKSVDQDQKITFVNGSSDFGNNAIGITTASVDETGSTSTNATGSKDVGTPAKGSVTIFNVDTNPASLSAGTTLTSSNGLKYTLDNDVNVPASNGDPTNLQSGQAQANITSSDIGTNYNLPGGTKFTFASSSLIAAKNDNPLSGGTKNTVTIVAQADLDKLSSDITNTLSQKAKDDLAKQADGSKTVLPGFLKEELSQKTYSQKVGDQAKTVSLNATVTYTTGTYAGSDLNDFALQSVKNQLSSDLVLAPNGLQLSLTDVNNDNGQSSATLKIKALLIPKIDTTQIAKNIAGKSFTDAGNSLQNIPQVNSATITLSPSLPFLPKVLPRLSNHIRITIDTNE